MGGIRGDGSGQLLALCSCCPAPFSDPMASVSAMGRTLFSRGLSSFGERPHPGGTRSQVMGLNMKPRALVRTQISQERPGQFWPPGAGGAQTATPLCHKQ